MNIPNASASPPETAQPTAFPAIYRGTVVRGRYSFMKPLLTSSMKDAVYGSAASMGRASAMASEDSAPMIRSLWKPGESSSAERNPASMP